MDKKWTAPSRKWLAARVTELTALAVLIANAGAWTKEATIAAIGVVSAGAIAYLLPNDGEGERGQANAITLLIYVIVAIILLVVLLKVVDRL